jgi:hypothetical protein
LLTQPHSLSVQRATTETRQPRHQHPIPSSPERSNPPDKRANTRRTAKG